jgi:Homeodomain-like domain
MPQHRLKEVTARRAQVATLYLQGKYQTEIATLVGCSQRQVSHDLSILQRQWLQSSLVDLDKRKAIELQRLDELERHAWEGWERSKSDKEVSMQETNSKGEHKVRRFVHGQAGDPRFLETALRCIERRCQILGLDAAKKFALDWESLSDEQLERLAMGEPVQAVLALPATPARPVAEA